MQNYYFIFTHQKFRHSLRLLFLLCCVSHTDAVTDVKMKFFEVGKGSKLK